MSPDKQAELEGGRGLSAQVLCAAWRGDRHARWAWPVKLERRPRRGTAAAAAHPLSCVTVNLPAHAVRPVREGDEAWGTRQECSICLEGVAADGGAAWMVFPCHHGACAACLADLVR